MQNAGSRERRQRFRREAGDGCQVAGRERGKEEQRKPKRHGDGHGLTDGAGQNPASYAGIIEGKRGSGTDRKQSSQHSGKSPDFSLFYAAGL